MNQHLLFKFLNQILLKAVMLGRRNILIFESDLLVAEMLEIVIEELTDYEAPVEKDEYRAIDRIEKFSNGVIIVIKEIQEIKKHLIIEKMHLNECSSENRTMCTYNHSSDIDGDVRGIDCFIRKPFDVSALIESIEKLSRH